MTTTIQVANCDWVIDGRTGAVATIENETKLKQDLNECLSVSVQGNGFGCGLDDQIGTVDEPLSGSMQIQSAISSGVARMQQLQSRYLLAYRTQGEVLKQVTNLQVTPVVNDKTSYWFRIDVRSQAGGDLALSGTVA